MDSTSSQTPSDPTGTPSRPIPLNLILSLVTMLSFILTGYFIYQNQLLQRRLAAIESSQLSNLTQPTPAPTTDKTADLPIVTSPKPDSIISSPITITGNIPKSWTWEANFIIEVQSDRRIPLSSTPVSANFADEADEFAPFSTSISFSTNSKTGLIVIKSDNPSGLPENQKIFEIPIHFASTTGETQPIKIFFYDTAKDPNVEKCEANSFETRQIPKTQTPLRDAINLLIRDFQTKDETYADRAKSFKLISAVITNGVAKLTFEDPLFFTSGGSCRIGIIVNSIEKTAKQFPSVKSVELLGAPFQP